MWSCLMMTFVACDDLLIASLTVTVICVRFPCTVKSTSFPSIDHFSTPMSDSKPRGFAALMKMRKQEKKEEEEKVKPVIREASLSCSSCQ